MLADEEKKREFTLFSDHNGSLLRRQPGAAADEQGQHCMCAGNSNIACKSDITWQSLLAEVFEPSLGFDNITARSAN